MTQNASSHETDDIPGRTAGYSLTAMFFHWVMALLILVNIALAWSADSFVDPDAIMRLHVSIGLTLLVLLPIRLVTRLVQGVPVPASGVARYESILARSVHWGFYLTVLAMVLTGWLSVSSGRDSLTHPPQWFGAFDWPLIFRIAHLPAQEKHAIHEFIGDMHGLIAYIICALFVLHVGGMVKHRLIDRRNVLLRMLPWKPSVE